MDISENNKRITVLGSTGSVGTQALDALGDMGCTFDMLTGGHNIALLEKQARQYHPSCVSMPEKSAASDLKVRLADTDIRVLCGREALLDRTVNSPSDVIVHSVAGLAGLDYAMAAARSGKRIAISNKEAIISAGELIYNELRKSGGELIPVDSEHSAIYQCLESSGAVSPKGAGDATRVKRILLTASGGPFFGKTKDEIYNVTPDEALAHPTWKMGKKITIDCATMMNKGFEVIEAVRLFGVDENRVEVLVHRQSIIHSMVEYNDNTVIAQLGRPDMRTCIRYAVTCPERAVVDEAGLDFTQIASLTFDKPDNEAFPLLNAAREAVRHAGTAPTALIAADEEAVAAFACGDIPFGAIAEAVMNTMAKVGCTPCVDTDSIAEAQGEARRVAASEINKLRKR